MRRKYMPIQYTHIENKLTTPRSFFLRHVVSRDLDIEDMAKIVSRLNPNYSPSLVSTVIKAFFDEVENQILEGNRVSLENFLSFHINFVGRKDSVLEPVEAND